MEMKEFRPRLGGAHPWRPLRSANVHSKILDTRPPSLLVQFSSFLCTFQLSAPLRNLRSAHIGSGCGSVEPRTTEWIAVFRSSGLAVADPGFPRGGANPKRGDANLLRTNFLWKTA